MELQPLRVLCVLEDRAFEDVALPAALRVAEETGKRLELRQRLTHGCRVERLEAIVARPPAGIDLWLFGADAGKLDGRRKERGFRKTVEPLLSGAPYALAVPEPCCEGWLQADLAALKGGIADELGDAVTLPSDTGAYPAGEQAAKDRLRKLLEMADVPCLRGGLEFGPAVMRRAKLTIDRSLERFTSDLRHVLNRL